MAGSSRHSLEIVKVSLSMNFTSRKSAQRSTRKLTVELASIPEISSLPASIDTLAFAQARKTEIDHLKNEISAEAVNKRSVRQVFQQLPKTLRRRAASHDIRRLPSKLRQKALSATSANKPSISLPPKGRRRRRRPAAFLQSKGSIGQNGIQFLQTHIWHAKRSHMVDYFGYRIARKCNEKALKSTLRASIDGCFLVDLSYYAIIRISDSSMSKLPLLNTNQGLFLQPNGSIVGPFELVQPFANESWLAFDPSLSESVEKYLTASGINFERLHTFSCFRLSGSKALATLSAIFRQRVTPDKHVLLTQDPRRISLNSQHLGCEFGDASEPDLSDWKQHFFSLKCHASEAEIIAARSALCIPGGELSLADKLACFLAHSVFHASYFLLLPNHWAITVWRSLTFLGARFGCQEELAHAVHQAGRSVFPIDFPGCPSYIHYSEKQLLAKKTAHFRRPPSKRGVNFDKLGIPDPFISPFTLVFPHLILVHERPDLIQQSHFMLFHIHIDSTGFYGAGDAIYNSSDELVGFVTSSWYSQLKGRVEGFGVCQISNYTCEAFIKDRNTGSSKRWNVRLSECAFNSAGQGVANK